MPYIEFAVEKLPLSGDVLVTWASLISLTGFGSKLERDSRDRDRAPLAASPNTGEPEGVETG